MPRWFWLALDLLLIPLRPLSWLLARIEAKPCPQCGELWHTELIGEWGDEMWECRRCAHCWVTPYSVE